jgi:hypothetical protein
MTVWAPALDASIASAPETRTPTTGLMERNALIIGFF